MRRSLSLNEKAEIEVATLTRRWAAASARLADAGDRAGAADKALAYSNGNLFVSDIGDIYKGIGDFGADGNDRWSYRIKLNLRYDY